MNPTPIRPRRIQRRRTKGWRIPAGAVYVGRPTMYGNPFAEHFTPAERVTLYRLMLRGRWKEFARRGRISAVGIMELQIRRKWILDHVGEIRDRDLACWCPLDGPCHADVLLKLANKEKR